jgi:hypothetical protein
MTRNIFPLQEKGHTLKKVVAQGPGWNNTKLDETE